MARFVEGMDRGQATLLPECLEDWVGENTSGATALSPFDEATAGCGKISAGRTATRGAPEALSAEFNSEAERRS
jgi:hypothetical protein